MEMVTSNFFIYFRVALNERVSQIKEQIHNTTSTYDKEKLEERLSKLVGGVGIFKVGGGSDIEVGEIKDRVQDAICATRAALEEGIVVGGGCALLYAARALNNLKPINSEQALGINIIKKAITLPCKTIADNAGFEGITVVEKIHASNDFSYGFDASKGEYTNLIERGIIDPAKVVRVALEDASSVSGLMSTTECMIVDKKEDKPAGGM
jgi:chaperonin GroEL